MHTFPKEPYLKLQRVKFVQVKRANFIELSKDSVVYSSHLSPNCFEATWWKWAIKKLLVLVLY